MAEKQILITRFDGGVVDEKRDLADGYFRHLENVNCGYSIRGIRQIANTVTADGKVSGFNKALRAVFAINQGIYGLGLDPNATGNTAIWTYSSPTWTPTVPAANYTMSTKANPFFIYAGVYSGSSYLLYNNLNHIGLHKIGTDGSGPSSNGDFLALSGGLNGGISWQGYFWGWNGQIIYKIDCGDFSATQSITSMITIPITQTVVELVDLGNLMGIICTSQVEESKMYLWDGVSTTTFYDIIKIGKGTVMGAAILDGAITAIINSPNDKNFEIKQYDEIKFVTKYYYSGRKNTSGAITLNILSRVKSYQGYIYFVAKGTKPNSAETGSLYMFRYGKKTTESRNAMCVYKDFNYVPNVSYGQVTDFIILDDDAFSIDSGIFFVAVTDDDSGATIKEVKTGTSYTAQAGVIQTGIYTGGNSSIEKQLSEMSIQCEPLTSGQSIALYYKPDADTSWTLITTINTVGTISYEPTLENSGANFRTSKEVAFRFLLLGGAELTGFSARYEEELGQR